MVSDVIIVQYSNVTIVAACRRLIIGNDSNILKRN